MILRRFVQNLKSLGELEIFQVIYLLQFVNKAIINVSSLQIANLKKITYTK